MVKIDFKEVKPQTITIKIGKNKVEMRTRLRNYETVVLYDRILNIALQQLDFFDLYNYTQIPTLKDIFYVEYCTLVTDIDFSEVDYEEVLNSGVLEEVLSHSIEINSLWGEFLEILKMENTRRSLKNILESVPSAEDINHSVNEMAKYTAELEAKNPNILNKMTDISLLNHATEAGKETLNKQLKEEKKKRASKSKK